MLFAQGCRVFAACLLKDKNGDGAKQLESLKRPNLHVLQLDVANQKEVDSCLGEVEHIVKSNKERECQQSDFLHLFQILSQILDAEVSYKLKDEGWRLYGGLGRARYHHGLSAGVWPRKSKYRLAMQLLRSYDFLVSINSLCVDC